MRLHALGRPAWKSALSGSLFGFLLFEIFNLTQLIATRSAFASLAYSLSELAVCVPAVLASLLGWNLFLIFAIGYWTFVGYLAYQFRCRLRTFVFLLLTIHLVTLLLVDLTGPFIPAPF